MGRRVAFVNDIYILHEMLKSSVRVPLQQKGNQFAVKLNDNQSQTTVEITNLPDNTVVINTEVFEPRKVIFNGLKDERRRADFAIVSIENTKKWIIYIEIKSSNLDKDKVIAQLRGAKCVIDYYKSVGREFWAANNFLKDYEYRFVGIAALTEKQSTRTMKPANQSKTQLHDSPETFLPILEQNRLYFKELI